MENSLACCESGRGLARDRSPLTAYKREASTRSRRGRFEGRQESERTRQGQGKVSSDPRQGARKLVAGELPLAHFIRPPPNAHLWTPRGVICGDSIFLLSDCRVCSWALLSAADASDQQSADPWIHVFWHPPLKFRSLTCGRRLESAKMTTQVVFSVPTSWKAHL